MYGASHGILAQTLLTEEFPRSLLLIDTDLERLRAWRAGVTDCDRRGDLPLLFAVLADPSQGVRDASADTVISASIIAEVSDVRAFLSGVYHALRPGGRALFVVPNRRYFRAACMSVAEALTQRFAQDGTWPESCEAAMRLLERTRLLLVRPEEPEFLRALVTRHLFDSDVLQEVGRQLGFETADILPLAPDPYGAVAIAQMCQDEGASETFARDFGALAATIGRPFLSLLSYQDSSAFSLFCLTKAAAPDIHVYTSRAPEAPMLWSQPEAALGGAPLRWSIELLPRATAAGIVLKVGGWCLANVDALGVRITIAGQAWDTPIWRHRPDVHEVLNRPRIYPSFNAICSGIDDELLFRGIHPENAACLFQLDIVLTGGLVATRAAPEKLIMDQQMVIAH